MKQILVLVALVSLTAATSMAQLPGIGVAFGVQGNAANINVEGDLKEVYGMGYGGGAHLDLKLTVLSLRLSGDYVSFSPDNDKYRSLLARLTGGAASGFSLDGGKISILSAHVNAKWGILPLPLIVPYFTGGVGLARMSADEVKVTFNGATVGNFPQSKSETSTLVNAGVGADLNLPGISLFIEARYTWIFTEGSTSTYIPIAVGITF